MTPLPLNPHPGPCPSLYFPTILSPPPTHLHFLSSPFLPFPPANLIEPAPLQEALLLWLQRAGLLRDLLAPPPLPSIATSPSCDLRMRCTCGMTQVASRWRQGGDEVEVSCRPQPRCLSLTLSVLKTFLNPISYYSPFPPLNLHRSRRPFKSYFCTLPYINLYFLCQRERPYSSSSLSSSPSSSFTLFMST